MANKKGNRFHKALKHLKSSQIEEKIKSLNEDLKKTGVLCEAPTNSTSGLYQQGDTVTIPPVLDGWNSYFPDGPEGPTTSGGGGAKLSGDGNFGSESFLYIRSQYPMYTKNNGVYPYNSTGYWEWVWVSPNFAASWGNLTNSFGEKYGVTPGGRYIQGYYTSLSAIDTRLIAGGSKIFQSDPDVGYREFYWSNNYPATKVQSGGSSIDDPKNVVVWGDANKDKIPDRTKNILDKLKDMLDAGKEWWDKTVLDNIEKKKEQIKDLISDLIDSTESVLDKIWDLSSQALDNLVGSGSAADALSAYLGQQLGTENYTNDRPYNVKTTPNQAQEWSDQFDNVIRQVNPKDITNLTGKELEAINQGMSNAPYPWGVIFHNLGRPDAIKPLPNGGYEIRDNYLFDSPDDFEGGEIEIPSRDGGTIRIGPRGPFTAIAGQNNGRGTHTYWDKDPKAHPDAKKIGEVVNMPVSIALPPPTRINVQVQKPIASFFGKEEISMGVIIKELLLEENIFEGAIERIKTFEQVTMQLDTDPVFKKVSKRLKKEIDYQGKPSENGYPNEDPPKLVNGWHPNYGKRSHMYNSLDKFSAMSMPLTGDYEIDLKVQKARKLKSVKAVFPDF